MSYLSTTADILVANAPVIATFLISYWFLFVYLPRKPKNFPPGPKGLPIVGVAFSIGQRPEKTFREWSKKFGDVIGFKVGSNYTVVLNSYEKIQEAMVKYGSTFGSRPNNIVFTDGFLKSGIAGSDHCTNYMSQRHFAHGVLGKLGFGKTAMEPFVLEEVQHLIESLGEGKVELDTAIKKKIKFASANVVAQVAFGQRFPDINDPDFVTIMTGWGSFFHDGLPAFNAALISPWLLHLPKIRDSANIVRTGLNKVVEIVKRVIREHKEILDPNNPRDFIDALLIEQAKNGTETLYTDKMIECMVRDLFGGGLETTELVLIFCILVLANRPHIMKKVHDEIDSTIGENGKARYAMREKMPYSCAVIKEVMRYRSVGPLLLPHAVHENVMFKGYEIPKEATVIANVYAVQNSEKHWDKPEEFNPDRFINEDGKVEGSKFLMPFGIGPRICIGRPLAEMEMFIYFVSLFQHYDVIPTPKPGCDRPWVDDDVARTGLTVHPPDDTPVTLIPRQCKES